MADLALAILGIGLSAPGVAVTYAQFGDYLYETVRSVTNAPKIVVEIGAFGHDLHQGKLKLDLDLAEWAFEQEDLPVALKDSLEDHIGKLRAALLEAKRTLDSLFDRRGEVNRAKFALIGRRKALQTVEGLKRWQADFAGIISLIDMRKRIIPDDLLLSNDKFKLHWGSDHKECSTPLAGSEILVAKAEYKERDKNIRPVDVLMERNANEIEIGATEMRAVASYLACRLNGKSATYGILKCLGYRRTPEIDLVFEIPSNFSLPRTLQNVISVTAERGYGGGYGLEERFRLAREICEAVLSVHTSGLVHKNIRPDTIIVFSEQSKVQKATDSHAPVLGPAFLTHWSMLRKVNDLTSRRGEDDWMKDVYRHPRRQGMHPEDRYNMGHDIYSLGVCLLEISLWEPLILVGAENRMCELFRDTAVALECVTTQEALSTRKLTAPRVLQKVMVNLAGQQVPQRMGTLFANFIIACLTCLEGGMGEVKVFECNSVEAGVRFHEMVVSTFSGISYWEEPQMESENT